ncbi:hypothetical protein PHET_10359 [Paragonimus heterotremus]|uniref:Dpy-30 histone methyltransferase complex regulatory subunit n=1 Tax=Paragonimus heterotremus TaxID=100268 RepID=A0A8J4WEA6_9TREM|nr:hypothetical protein PHET_10359 [Paragonimus heterotremus]
MNERPSLANGSHSVHPLQLLVEEREGGEDSRADETSAGSRPTPNVPYLITPTLHNLIETVRSETDGELKAAELQALPARLYLEKSVVPVLILGLQSLIKEKPKKPVEYLAAFLIKNKNPEKE